VVEPTASAVAALGLREGPVHAELRVNNNGAWIVEIAARSTGGVCVAHARTAPASAIGKIESVVFW
jgi:hypothetical protein